jgi:hypothetical protein
MTCILSVPRKGLSIQFVDTVEYEVQLVVHDKMQGTQHVRSRMSEPSLRPRSSGRYAFCFKRLRSSRRELLELRNCLTTPSRGNSPDRGYGRRSPK